jgi:hypothetical protein
MMVNIDSVKETGNMLLRKMLTPDVEVITRDEKNYWARILIIFLQISLG